MRCPLDDQLSIARIHNQPSELQAKATHYSFIIELQRCEPKADEFDHRSVRFYEEHAPGRAPLVVPEQGFRFRLGPAMDVKRSVFVKVLFSSL